MLATPGWNLSLELPRQPLFVILYIVSIAAVILGARRYLRGRCYSLEDWRHYKLFTFLRDLNFESLEKMRLIERISIEKYLLNRKAGHITYALIFGGLALFMITLALAVVWMNK